MLHFQPTNVKVSHLVRVNNLYLSINVPLKKLEKVLQDLPFKRSLYGSFTNFLSTMRPSTKMQDAGSEKKKIDSMVVTV